MPGPSRARARLAVCACVCACACACVRACACVCACLPACLRACACVCVREAILYAAKAESVRGISYSLTRCLAVLAGLLTAGKESVRSELIPTR